MADFQSTNEWGIKVWFWSLIRWIRCLEFSRKSPVSAPARKILGVQSQGAEERKVGVVMDELENLNLLKKLTQGNVNKRVKWGIWTDCSPSMLEGFVVQAVCIPARKRDEVGHFHLNAGSVRGAKPTGTHWLATFDLQGNLLNVSRMISNLDTLSGKDGFRIFGRELMYPNVEDARRNKEALDLIENLLRGLRTDPRLLACESPGYDLFP